MIEEACLRGRGRVRGHGGTTPKNRHIARESSKLDAKLNFNVEIDVGFLQKALVHLILGLERAGFHEDWAVRKPTTLVGASVDCVLEEVHVPTRHEVGMVTETWSNLVLRNRQAVVSTGQENSPVGSPLETTNSPDLPSNSSDLVDQITS